MSGAVTWGIGTAFQVAAASGPFLGGTVGQEIGRAAVHGYFGYINGAMNDNGEAGFWAAAASSLAGSIGANIPILNTDGGGAVMSAAIGGMASSINGGDFMEGATQGLLIQMLNHNFHKPQYLYKGKKYSDKTKLYFDILLDETAEQFGITDIIALAAVLDNQGLISKPFVHPNASKGTSYASKYGAKLLPQELPVRLPTRIRGGTVRYTKVLGRFLGRAAGPIGWGILAYDVGKVLYNTQIMYNSIVD